jgi:hypothetical protein
VDCRVYYRSAGRKNFDLLSIEFANGYGSDKFIAEHGKVLREAKINVDRLYRSNHINERVKKGLRGHEIQIAGIERQFNEVKLVDSGL